MESTGTPSTMIPSAAEQALVSARRVVIATDDNADEALERVRSITRDLATRFDFEVVLYDRSGERWTDHPHPKGPVTAADLDGTDHDHVATQLRDLESAGVTASAWLATVPALTAMLDVLQDMDVDAVLLPDQLESPKMMDRLQVGDSVAEMVGRVADLNLTNSPALLTADADGSVRLAEEVAS